MVIDEEMVQQLLDSKKKKEIRKVTNKLKMELYMMENKLMSQLCGDMSMCEYESYLYTYMIIRKEIVDIFKECIDNNVEQSNLLLKQRLQNNSIDFNESKLAAITKCIFSLAPVATKDEIKSFFDSIMKGGLQFLKKHQIGGNFTIEEFIINSYNHTIV